MADSSVAVTAGSGTAIDTRTESTNGNHRQVIVVGDPSTNAGVAPVDSVKGLAVDLSQTGSFPSIPAGNNNIGDVDIATQPARAATIDTITAKLATDAIQNGTTALTPKFAVISASSSGNNTLIAAVTSKKIRVLAYNFIANGTVNAKFQSGASGTDLTGLKYCVANSGICANFNPVGWFETASNTLLNLNLSAAIAVGGEIVYVEV